MTELAAGFWSNVGAREEEDVAGLAIGASTLLADLASSASFFFFSASFLVPGNAPNGLSVSRKASS